MIVLLILVALAAAVAATIGVTWWATRRSRSILHDRLRQTIVVTLKSGETYRGALSEQDPQALVLRGTVALGRDGSTVGVDGELLILRPDVAYIQRP